MSELNHGRREPLEFGPYIRQARERQGLTIKELADRSQGKLSQTAISVIERNKYPAVPSARILEGFSDVLGLNIGYLFMLAYYSDKGMDLTQVDQAWEDISLASMKPAGRSASLSVPRMQREQLGLSSDAVSFYIVSPQMRITLEASHLNLVLPGDVIAVDAERTPVHGSLMLAELPEWDQFLLYRLGIDCANVLVQARTVNETHKILPAIEQAHPVGSVVWRCGQLPS
jgi:transcriptional regulator with XRE-family HTH domain